MLKAKTFCNRSFFRTVLALFVLILFGDLGSSRAAIFAQEPLSKPGSVPSAGTVLRQTVRRVRVDVVVTDAQGRPVPGLQASDFHIAEDGKAQSIRQFEYHSEQSEQAALPKRPLLPPRTFMNLPEVPERGPLTVVLYDLLNTASGERLYAHEEMLHFLKKSSGRRMAVFALGDQLRLLQGFTSNTDQLVSAVNGIGITSRMGYDALLSEALINNSAESRARQTGVLPPTRRTMPAEQRMSERQDNATRAYASRLRDDRIGKTLDAFVQIGRFLQGMKGRKNLIWYSGSFPIAVVPDPSKTFVLLPRGKDSLTRDDWSQSYYEQIKTTTNFLNTAEVAVYPVDARGLNGTEVPFKVRALEFATMDTVGEQTGGRAFYNTNGLQEALERAAVDGSSYYSLLYAPTNSSFDGSLRHISVRLVRQHYHLAYRRSYLAKDPDSSEKLEAATPGERVAAQAIDAASQFGAPASREVVFAAHIEALGSPLPATAEQVAALAPYRAHAASIAHRTYTVSSSPVQLQAYVVQFAILASQLELSRSADGIYHPHVSLAALAFSQDGETLWGTKSHVEDSIPEAKIAGVRENGYEVQLTVSVPANAAVIRLVVCDESRGRTGSMEIALPLDQHQTNSVKR